MLILAITIMLLTFLFLYLSKRVIMCRRQHQVPYAQAVESKAFQAAISAHRNFVDYTPFGMMILFLCLLQTINTFWFIFLCLNLLLGRYFHAYGLLKMEQRAKPSFKGRTWGMILTFNSILLSSMTLLYKSF